MEPFLLLRRYPLNMDVRNDSGRLSLACFLYFLVFVLLSSRRAYASDTWAYLLSMMSSFLYFTYTPFLRCWAQ
ncbi:hypothetical protein F5Y06DRAFT_130124 [Hypoxylon sp. FL0890]|nr:hypothetical protein F5Y06DRAFT_130124 [Hypoxylon sp. FL0890]